MSFITKENQKGFPINIKHCEVGKCEHSEREERKKVHESNKLKLYDQSI